MLVSPAYHGPFGSRWISSIGAEPGIDTNSERRSSHSDLQSDIKIVDYSDKRVMEHDLSSSSLESFLKEQAKPDWAACRWIYVNGLNQDVMRCLGNQQGLHRLSLEDVLDTNTPTKVDWYDSHCFMELTLQKLVNLQLPEHENFNRTDLQSDPGDLLDQNLSERRAKWRLLSYRKFAMSVEQVSIFLTADNTVITIFEQSGHHALTPILTRLNSPRTIIRSSNDASMLVHAVIDVIVDLSIPIGRAVDEIFGELEGAVLSRPTIGQSKQLYVLRSGLTLLMDNTIATGGLVRTLIDHRALPNPPKPNTNSMSGDVTQQALSTSVQISPTTQVYLQDVQDHITALSNSTRMSIRSAENLTSLIFNTIAASQNESVRQLTLVSSFFLPLTFLTGYFGMNFDPMPVVNNHSDIYFWFIAGPVMLVTAILLGTRAARLRSLTWKQKRVPTRRPSEERLRSSQPSRQEKPS